MKPRRPYTVVQAVEIVTSYSSAWEEEPPSEERLCSDPHYLKWACKKYGVKAVGKLRLDHRKAVQGSKYRRNDEIAAMAADLGMSGQQATKLRNTLNRSSRVIGKRR
jgi:hypothetical protein